MLSVPVARRGALATLLCAGAGCQPPTEVTVALSTNVPCEAIDGTGLVVGTPDDVESKDVTSVTATCDDGRIGTMVILPGKDREAVFAVKVVTGVQVLAEECLTSTVRPTDVPGEKGCIVARRELGFLPQTPLTLPIEMRLECIGVSCPPGSTCVEGGACVGARIADPNRCADPGGCDETALGEVVSSSSSSSSSSSGGTGGMGAGGAGGAAP